MVDFIQKKIEAGKTLFFPAIYLKPCTHLDTLWFQRTMWRLSFCLLIHGMYSSSLLCLILFDFPLQRCIFVRILCFHQQCLTFRQHIWCSHFFSNNCTKRANSGIKDCVFSLRVVHSLQPMGRLFLPRANPTCLIGWQLQHLATLPQVLLGYFFFHYPLRPFISI